MTKPLIYKTLFFFSMLFYAFCGSAQSHVEQVLVANGGAYAFTGNYITIGSYRPSTQKYTLFDSVTGGSVTQVLIDSGYAYMATDSYLVKYNLGSLKREAIAKCHELRYLAVYKDKIVATIGYDLTTTHLKIFKKSDLSLVYSENKIPNIYANGITISGDSAYIALQGQYPSYDTIGRIAVEDLANQKFKRVITLDTIAAGVGDMFTNGNTIVGVTEYSCMTEINLKTGAKNTTVFNGNGVTGIGVPFALIHDTLYADYQNDLITGIGGYNLSTKTADFYIKPDPYCAAAALDTINKLFYYTGGSYTKPTKTWIYNYNNKAVDSFNVGIAPEGIAIDYELNSGITSQSFTTNDLILYPNPAKNLLNISGIDAANAEVKIVDLTGRVLSSQISDLYSKKTMSIPVSQLPVGIYFVTIQNSEGIVSKKFVKN